jgi:hypothetical protein
MRAAQRHRARAEFRRLTRDSGWVLEGIEPIRGRLPEAGLLAWRDLPAPIVARDPESAAAIALDVARVTWPEQVREPVPFSGGVADDG